MGEPISVEVETTFDAAHRLMKHAGKCKHLHGHTYRVLVEVYGRQLDPEQHVLMDFADLKAALKLVVDHYDHALLLNYQDPILAPLRQAVPGLRVATFEDQPTAEIIARSIKFNLQRIIETGKREIIVRRVKVWETPTVAAIA